MWLGAFGAAFGFACFTIHAAAMFTFPGSALILFAALAGAVSVWATQWADHEGRWGHLIDLASLGAAVLTMPLFVVAMNPVAISSYWVGSLVGRRMSRPGLVEYMVTSVCQEADRLGVSRLSLNFAVLRSVFARGERIGAGPVLRIWHRVLLGLSRFWQIESLYRANAKYQPTWYPRFLCFANASDLPRVASAALRAEAFITRPRWLRRSGPR